MQDRQATKDIVKSSTSYNKARQAGITQILEILRQRRGSAEPPAR